MARFRIGPVRVGGGRKVSFTARAGPFGVTVGGRHKRRWSSYGGRSKFDNPVDHNWTPYDPNDETYRELTAEEKLLLAQSDQRGKWGTRENIFFFVSSKQLNRMVPLILASFIWINFREQGSQLGPTDWSLAVGGIVFVVSNLVRLYTTRYLSNGDHHLSLFPEDQREKNAIPEWYEMFAITENRRIVNVASLVLLGLNLAWAFTSSPKPEYPGINLAIILGLWFLARVLIVFKENGVGAPKFFINILRFIVVYILWNFVFVMPGLAFSKWGFVMGVATLFVASIVGIVATQIFWTLTKVGAGGSSTHNRKKTLEELMTRYGRILKKVSSKIVAGVKNLKEFG